MIYTYILLFFIYSFLGWILEVLTSYVKNHKLVNRGFFIGFYCPIYGFGSLAFTVLLKDYKSDLLVLFVMSMLICSILEYFTSLLMEKLFHARWWDYTNYKFNINGRICLETMIPFGLLGCLVIYILNPFFISIIEIIPIIFIKIITIILIILFAIDNILSFGIIANIKNLNLNSKKDSTEEITKKVKEVLMNKNFLTKRLILAFPDFEMLRKKTLDKIKFTKKDIKNRKKEIKKMQKEIAKKTKELNKISKE